MPRRRTGLASHARASQRYGIRSSVVVPMVQAGVPLGVVAVLSRRPFAFDADDVPMTEVSAATTALRLAQVIAAAEQDQLRAWLKAAEQMRGAVPHR